MRRVAFISDLHANLVALDAVLADIDTLGVQEIVCLGDIVDLGGQPAELLERLHERGIPCIRGNHDGLDEHPPLPKLLEIERWTREQLSAAQLRELDALPTELELDLDGVRVLCVHATPINDTDQILDDTPRDLLDEWFEGRTFDVLVGGHTHVQLVRRLDHRMIVNVGSASMPFARPFVEGGGAPKVLPWAEYGILSGSGGRASVELRQVDFDMQAYADAVRAAGFPDADEWIASMV